MAADFDVIIPQYSQLEEMNKHLKSAAASLNLISADQRAVVTKDPAELAALIRDGELEEVMDYGDQMVDTWTDTSPTTEVEYDNPWNFCHLEDGELEDGETIPVADFQMHYTTPAGIPFDPPEAIFESDSALAAGTYNFTVANDSWGGNNGKTIQFTLPSALPAGYQIRKSAAYDALITSGTLDVYESGASLTKLYSMTPSEGSSGTSLGTTNGSGDLNHWHRVALGYNRWKYSFLRQWLNSDGDKGEYWEAQNKWDVIPAQANNYDGFMKGLTDTLKAHIRPCKVVTIANNIDSNAEDVTYDKIFLPSLEQLYVSPQKSGEGDYWEYYKRLLGASSPVARSTTYARLISTALNAKSSAQTVFQRSAGMSGANGVWCVTSSGYVTPTNAHGAYRCRPCLRLG